MTQLNAMTTLDAAVLGLILAVVVIGLGYIIGWIMGAFR